MQWFYSLNAQRLGPVSASEFEALVQAGTIKPDTLVWHEGMANWTALAQLSAADRATDNVDDGTAVCIVSGQRFPKREMIQYEGKWVSAQHRDEFFQRLREGVPMPGGGPVPGPFGYAGFWRRVCARLVDGLLMLLVSALIGALMGTKNALGWPSSSPLIGLLTPIIYECFFIHKYDATLGKMALGLKIFRPDGSKLSIGRIIGRYLAYILASIILCIGLIMVAFDPEKRGLHDRICDTRVIKTR